VILARHAEALFWAGRQIERSETTARALGVVMQSVMHLPVVREQSEWVYLIEMLGLEGLHTGAPDSAAVAHFLFEDQHNPGSVSQTVAQMRENIRTVRDRIPVELWEEVNRLHLMLVSSGGLTAQEPFDLLASVRRGCQALSGVVAESMPRDEGYAFLILGRTLERAITTCRMLRVSCSRPDEWFEPAVVLRIVAALQAFRRAQGYDTDRMTLTTFLLQAETVPRSVYSCLRTGEQRLERLSSEIPGLTTPRRLCGRLRSELEFGTLDGDLARDPGGFLARIERELMELAEVIAAHAFAPTQNPLLHAQYVRPGGSQL